MTPHGLPLTLVDGLTLGDDYRRLLRPGETVTDAAGRMRTLPRYFFQVDSWAQALDLHLTENFSLWEFIDVDLYEPDLLRQYPRFVPCAVTLLATALELLRREVSTTVHIAANGGYRSPSHRRSTAGSPHAWASAANVYRIGSEFLDTRERIERIAALAARVVPGARVKTFGSAAGETDDHVHLDLGFVIATPHDLPRGP